MVRLVIAVGFLAVFGFVAYVIVVLLKDHFNKKNETLNQKQSKTKTKK